MGQEAKAVPSKSVCCVRMSVCCVSVSGARVGACAACVPVCCVCWSACGVRTCAVCVCVCVLTWAVCVCTRARGEHVLCVRVCTCGVGVSLCVRVRTCGVGVSLCTCELPQGRSGQYERERGKVGSRRPAAGMRRACAVALGWSHGWGGRRREAGARSSGGGRKSLALRVGVGGRLRSLGRDRMLWSPQKSGNLGGSGGSGRVDVGQVLRPGG